MQRVGQKEEMRHHARAFEAELSEASGISLGVSVQRFDAESSQLRLKLQVISSSCRPDSYLKKLIRPCRRRSWQQPMAVESRGA